MNNISPEDQAALEATKAPLMEHLVELRKRLIWAAMAGKPRQMPPNMPIFTLVKKTSVSAV